MRNDMNNEGRSVLASLRALIPIRQLDFGEALIVAELQANRLLLLAGVGGGPVPTDLISQLPRITVTRREMPTSGMSYWDARAQTWVICLNAAEPLTRQRFTLLHEYKHIIDHGRTDLLYVDRPGISADKQAEQAADYFAGCALMSKRLLKRAWGEGLQQASALAAQFDVSVRAMDVRLAQLGLTEPRSRCAPPSTATRGQQRRGPTYYRQLSTGWLTHVRTELDIRELSSVRS